MAAKNVVDLDMTVDHPDDMVVVDGEKSATGNVIIEADVVDDVDPNDRLPDHAIVNSDGTVTLPLMFPQTLSIKKNGKIREEKYEQLIFHRLTGADQRAIATASEDMMTVVAFARTTKISQAVMNVLFDRMDASDINAGAQVLNSFFSTGRKTGK